MIVWLNGPFGVGKTTLAKELRQRWVTSTVCDPELFGPLVQKFTNGRYSDFAQAPLWRRLTIEAVLTLQDEYEHVIVPMGVAAPHLLEELFGALRSDGAQYVHVFLESDMQELQRRISQQAPGDNRDAFPIAAEDLHRTHSEAFMRAADAMPEETLRLRADKLRVVELADQVIATMTERAVGRPLRDSFEPLSDLE